MLMFPGWSRLRKPCRPLDAASTTGYGGPKVRQLPHVQGAARMTAKTTEQVRQICLRLPEAHEQETWEAPTFRVRSKIFAMLHQVDGALTVWMKAHTEERDARVAHDPARFFKPPYLGGRGWLGVRLDRDIDWDDLTDAITDSYRLIAPKRLAAQIGNVD